MVRKCGFFDCSNPEGENIGRCQSCADRLLNTCSACRRSASSELEVNLNPSLLKQKYNYEVATIIRNKSPATLQTKLDQLLPSLKLTSSEQEFISKAEKFLANFLAEKGGKQEHIDWFKLCSDCESEFENKLKDFLKKTPQGETIIKNIEEKKGKLEKFFVDNKSLIESSMNKEEWKKIEEKSEEEFYKQIATNPDNSQPDQNQPDRHKPPKTPKQKNNDNSVKINQLEGEIDKLKQEISNLKKPGNPTPPNNDTLRDKEKKLRDKETELKQLKETNSSSSNQKNPNLPLYIGISIGVIGIFFLIIALLVLQKKKKKKQ